MGYVARRVYKLIFDDHDGMEVVVGAMNIDQFFDLMELRESDDDNDRGKLIDMVAAHIRTWNLEDEAGEPFPVTSDSLRQIDADILLAIINTWVKTVSETPGFLGQKSKNGGPRLEDSTNRQDGLSESQLSSLAASSSTMSA